MQAKFILYSTDGCHLCELAKQVLLNFGLVQEQIQTIDIMDDDMLLSEYKESIPVVMNKENSKRLFWPFNVEDVEEIL
ncbi:glutaredoxin family protein [Alteromonadaceae bacterium M269]|nr:glutaredoxin family protein [Alteromonadaceae bacterium M269]